MMLSLHGGEDHRLVLSSSAATLKVGRGWQALEILKFFLVI